MVQGWCRGGTVYGWQGRYRGGVGIREVHAVRFMVRVRVRVRVRVG